MQAVIDFINTNVRDIFIPLTALALLRMGMCLAQLKRMAALREKKGRYHAVRGHCAEVGLWIGALVGLVLPIVVPGLWYVGLALAVAGGFLGQRIGTKKGRETDEIYRDVALELKREAEAEAAREAASHTLESGETTPDSNAERADSNAESADNNAKRADNNAKRADNSVEAPEAGETGADGIEKANETTEK